MGIVLKNMRSVGYIPSTTQYHHFIILFPMNIEGWYGSHIPQRTSETSGEASRILISFIPLGNHNLTLQIQRILSHHVSSRFSGTSYFPNFSCFLLPLLQNAASNPRHLGTVETLKPFLHAEKISSSQYWYAAVVDRYAQTSKKATTKRLRKSWMRNYYIINI